jgi:AraC family transcriptional regulator of adaptative response/methylated-DNA-[protein]-cysteine methyltransferase
MLFAVSRQAVLGRMRTRLPDVPWADITVCEWSTGDDALTVEYAFADSVLGKVLVANTPNGVCYLAPVGDEPEDVKRDFSERFSHSELVERSSVLQKQAVAFLDGKRDSVMHLHLRGTPFQTEIWRRIIRIPYGNVASYACLGGGNRYAQATGTAVGRNPVFVIVPCHRVVNSSGAHDHFFWGTELKRRLLGIEFGKLKTP